MPFELRVERPVFLGAESLALLFPLDDYAQRDGLDPSRADAAFDLVPQDRADAISDQAVEHAARLLRIEERLVYLGRMLDRLLYAFFGDLVEQDAPDLSVEAAPEPGRDMEGDRLAFAIRVGGEVDVVLAFGLLFYLLDYFRLAGDHMVLGLEIMLDIDAERALGQIDDMTDRRSYLEIGSEVPLDGLCLCRRFNDYEVLGHGFRVLHVGPNTG